MKLKKITFIMLFAVIMNTLFFSEQGQSKLSPSELIKLRGEWDSRLLEAAKQIAANPPQFELHYFQELVPQDLTEENYKNETMSFSVSIPYLKQIAGFENRELANNILNELHQIP